MSKAKWFFGGILFGGLTGVALGMLTAPKAGSEMRHEIAEKSDEIYRKAAFEIEELAERVDEMRSKVDELKEAAKQTA